MCKVYEFPKTMQLTPELEERTKQLAHDYADVLMDAMRELLDDPYNPEEMDKLTDIVASVYMEELERYVYSLDDEL